MTSYDNCMQTIRAAAGRDLSDDEMEALLEALHTRERFLRSRGTRGGRDPALQAADDVAEEISVRATIERRNAALNAEKRLQRVTWARSNFGHNLAEGVEAMLVGVNRAKAGSRTGAAQLQQGLRQQYLGGMLADLEASGHLALLTSGSMDREVARALWVIGRDDAEVKLAGMPREAVRIARTIDKWLEVSRLDANEAGAWIARAKNYGGRTTHAPERIRSDGSTAAYEAWQHEALRDFDFEAMGQDNPLQPDGALLRTLWTDLSTGVHLKAVSEDDELAQFHGPTNVAKKLSHQRVIRFKDADAWMNYEQRFGATNLRETVVNTLTRRADATGLMQVLGTNPGAMLETITRDLIKGATESGDVAQVARLRDAEGRIANYMAAIDGSMNIPGNALVARRMANIRAWEMLSKLGSMLLSQLNDVAVYGSGTRYHGRGFLSGVRESVVGLGRDLSDPETRQLAASLGVVLDNMAGELGRAGAFGEAGSMAKASTLFIKLNLSTWWTNHMRTSAAMGLSHDLAAQAGRGFEALRPDFQRVLLTYGITPAKWEVIRAAEAREVGGQHFLTPEALRTVDTPQLLALAHEAGVTPDAMRHELELDVRTYLVDQTQFLALEPDAKTKAIMLQGTRPGTFPGEAMRFLAQFKSFTGAYMQKILGRELYGRGYEGNSVLGALMHGNGEMLGLAQLIVTSTLMGYGSTILKDVAKGRTPRDPTASPGEAVQVLLASLVQGGGAGIYGDFLFGQASRAGSGTIESLAGPAPSAAGRIFDLYHRALAGDDVAARSVNEAINNTPFANLFYTRAALNYLVLYRLQEAMNPGYLRRMEREVQRDNAQGFLLRPSAVVQ